MPIVQQLQPISVEDYLAMEETTDIRHELVDGLLYAMNGKPQGPGGEKLLLPGPGGLPQSSRVGQSCGDRSPGHHRGIVHLHRGPGSVGETFGIIPTAASALRAGMCLAAAITALGDDAAP